MSFLVGELSVAMLSGHESSGINALTGRSGNSAIFIYVSSFNNYHIQVMVKLGVRNLVDEGLREYIVSEGPHNRNRYLSLVLVSGLKCGIHFSVKRLVFFFLFKKSTTASSLFYHQTQE